MSNELDDRVALVQFPTSKPHVSYSEIRTWKECPYRHKLTYIDKISVDEPSPYLSYGTAVHAALEEFLKTRCMDVSIALNQIKDEWEKHGFDSDVWIQAQADYRSSQGWKPKPHNYLNEWLEWAENCLNEIPQFLDSEFDEWETVSAEEELYEFVEGYDIFFKGFIDALLKVKIKGKEFYYVLDWKTAGDKGWYASKRRDILTWAQIALYKSFWMRKNNLDTKQVKCGFVLLKRGAKKDNTCELVKVSVGPKAEENALSIMRSMIKTVRRGIFLKNRDSCLFCEFKGTKNCPG
jgi:hypothetical protein